MTTSDDATTTKTPNSKGESVSELAAASARVSTLEPLSVWWANAVLILIGVGAFVGALYAGAEVMSKKRANALNAAKSEVIRLQEIERARERDASNARIADAGAAAAKANEGLEAQRAETARAKERAAALEVEAGKLKEQTAALVVRGKEADARTAKAELELVNIKKRQEWRKIPETGAFNSVANKLRDRLIEYVFQPGDEEASLLANSLHRVLRNGIGDAIMGVPIPIPQNWYRESLRHRPSVYREEVVSTPFLRIGSNAPGGITILSRSGEMDSDVKLLKETLEGLGLAVNIGETDSEMRPNVIVIAVGPKP